jgi:hypothetical protein
LSATPAELLFNFSGTDNGVVYIVDASLDFGVALSATADEFGTPGGVSKSCGHASDRVYSRCEEVAMYRVRRSDQVLRHVIVV